ncbi:DUF4190 domain-containing protein [Specibacter sp. RAF43]|uniref:DUF4190 domain-containing protein n=1 Tax=Specibacter sp. RAF43 TaxID=3233057 RepID=UPI003F9C9645
MSDQPDQPQPYSGTRPGYTPPGGPPQQPVPPAGYPAPPSGYPVPSAHGGYGSYGQPGQPHYGQPAYLAPTSHQGGPGYLDTTGPRGLSLASMIIGLGSLFLAGWLIVPQIVGIVLGHIGLRRESPQGKPFSITGLITSYLALVLYLAIYALGIYLYAALTDGAATTGYSSAVTAL